MPEESINNASPKKRTARKTAVLKVKKNRVPAKRKIAKNPKRELERKHLFRKFGGNPIVEPQTHRDWESKATFNPAAVYEGGRVHLLYRAIGDSDMSVLGYAASDDGLNIIERLTEPAYVPRETFEGAAERLKPVPLHVSPYMSGGGGWGGIEDPRMTKIEDKIYLTYVAYNGWAEPRIALSSIALKDFLGKNWVWTEPVLISPPKVIDKNACILPEKVDGKYVIFHRVYPNIQIDLVHDLNFDGKTKWLKPHGDHEIKPRKDYWDSRKIGAGAPPIRTRHGWLLIYQGLGEQDPSRYKIGAMLLDLKKPWRVLARSKQPILEPMEQYEIDGWKFGVVYPCGAVLIKNRLLVYYGGADKYVCVAEAKLDEFLEQLLADKEPELKRIKS